MSPDHERAATPQELTEMRAMVRNAMQIPTHDDVQELADRVGELTRVVEKLSGKPVAATRKAARKGVKTFVWLYS